MSESAFSLDNKKILILGASSGIGAATASLASQMGAQLLIVGRNEERLKKVYAELKGAGHTKILADLTKPDDRKDLLSCLPSLDGVFFSTGISRMAPLKYMTDEMLHEIFNINFFAPYYATRDLIKNKKLKDESSLLYMASIAPFLGIVGQSAYSPSKAAICSLTKVLANELSSKRIRVNCLCPSMVCTPMLANAPISNAQYMKDQEAYPLGYGKPDDVANAAIYFLSDASKWVTGTSFIMDGGLTLK